MVELPSQEQVSDYREPNQSNQSNSPQKINAIVTEYNFLLTSQLQAQRQYYEDQLESIRKETSCEIQLLKKRAEKYEEVKSNYEKLSKQKKEEDKKSAQMKEKLLSVIKDNSFLKQVNQQMTDNQDKWKTEIEKMKEQFKKKEENTAKEISDLKEQVRDLMFFIEAQKTVEKKEMGEIKDGDVVVVPNVAKPPLKKGRRKSNK